MFESATGRHAHALLPAASWLERWDVAISTVPFQQARLIQISGPTMKPLGETRTDAAILGDLAVAMGLPGAHWRLMRRGLDRWLPRPKYGVPGPRVRPGRWLQRNRLRFWDERVEAEVKRLRAQPERGSGRFVLIGRRRRLAHNSWLHGGQRTGEPEAVAWLSAEDLAELGIEEGATIEIECEAGSLRIPVRAAEGLSKGTVVVPHGLPGINVNALIPAGEENIERVSGQLTMTGIPTRVRVVRD